jgi:K+-sensing histidine kinase KdpD
VGLFIVFVIAVTLGPFHEHMTRATPALALVVPVVVAAVMGGRLAGFVVAGAATLALSLLIPPIGSPRVALPEDAVALAVFTVVAFIVSGLVSARLAGLERTDEQRKALLRSVSHDLRTPLATIRAVSTDLRAGVDFEPEARDTLLDLVINESERLDRFVANLLSMSRIEAGALGSERSSVDLEELVDDCVRRLSRALAESKVVVDIPEALPAVHADYAQIDEVVVNLLENAARHSPPGTTISVTAQATPSHVAVTVCDDGPGIDPSKRTEVFRPFRSGTQSFSGLGLAICKGIIDAHGGTINITDDSGQGTRVTFTLRRAR